MSFRKLSATAGLLAVSISLFSGCEPAEPASSSPSTGASSTEGTDASAEQAAPAQDAPAEAPSEPLGSG